MESCSCPKTKDNIQSCLAYKITPLLSLKQQVNHVYDDVNSGNFADSEATSENQTDEPQSIYHAVEQDTKNIKTSER